MYSRLRLLLTGSGPTFVSVDCLSNPANWEAAVWGCYLPTIEKTRGPLRRTALRRMFCRANCGWDGLDEARTWTLWRVLSPKTRGPGASQQPARIDDPFITDLLTNVFGNMPAEQPFWPLSPSAFRSRFRALEKSPGLPDNFTPASLRGSGATFLCIRTENTELTSFL